MAKRFGKVKSYDEWIEPYLVENTLELLEKEIPKLKNKIESVQLCFSTDPFMLGYKEIEKMSIKVIKLLNDNNIKCRVLTKGILPKELSKLSKENEYGITLISLNEDFQKKIEPGASSYKDRLAALKYLHNKGFKTWVSIEPYPTPNIIEQDLKKIFFGRTNYSKNVTSYKEHKVFYNEQAYIVIEFCKKNNIQYHIKEGTMTISKNKK